MKATERATIMAHCTERVPTATPDENATTVLRHLRGGAWDTINYIYITNDYRKLLGVVSLRELLVAPSHQKMSDIMKTELVVAHPHSEPARAGILAIQHAVKAIPVVTLGEGTLVGAVPADRIMRILHEEHTEGFLRLSGIQRGHPVVNIFQTSVFRLTKFRLPWLVIGFGGGIIATLVTGFFEETLRNHLALVFFVPIMVYMSGAVATQTETLYVRGLSLRPTHFFKHLRHEFLVGLLIGLCMAVLMYIFAALWVGEQRIALAVGLAMFVNISLATVIAHIIPTLLYWIKKDPALGAGPFANVVSDVVSLLIYFSITALLLA